MEVCSIAVSRYSTLEQFVVSGNDVLDSGTVLGLLQSQGADKNFLIGNRRGDALERSKFAAGQRQHGAGKPGEAVVAARQHRMTVEGGKWMVHRRNTRYFECAMDTPQILRTGRATPWIFASSARPD